MSNQVEPVRRPSGLTVSETNGLIFRQFVHDRCALGESLVVPLMILWHEFEEYSEDLDWFGSAAHFRSALEKAPWCTVENRPNARGKFKTVVMGLGVQPNGL